MTSELNNYDDIHTASRIIPLRVIDRPSSQAWAKDCVYDSIRVPVDLTLPVQLNSIGRPST